MAAGIGETLGYLLDRNLDGVVIVELGRHTPAAGSRCLGFASPGLVLVGVSRRSAAWGDCEISSARPLEWLADRIRRHDRGRGGATPSRRRTRGQAAVDLGPGRAPGWSASGLAELPRHRHRQHHRQRALADLEGDRDADERVAVVVDAYRSGSRNAPLAGTMGDRRTEPAHPARGPRGVRARVEAAAYAGDVDTLISVPRRQWRRGGVFHKAGDAVATDQRIHARERAMAIGIWAGQPPARRRARPCVGGSAWTTSGGGRSSSQRPLLRAWRSSPAAGLIHESRDQADRRVDGPGAGQVRRIGLIALVLALHRGTVEGMDVGEGARRPARSPRSCWRLRRASAPPAEPLLISALQGPAASPRRGSTITVFLSRSSGPLCRTVLQFVLGYRRRPRSARPADTRGR